MTTEEDFQRQLGRWWYDYQLRLVYADWLQENDDPRAEGYRWIAASRFRPDVVPALQIYTWFNASMYSATGPNRFSHVPENVFHFISGGDCLYSDGRRAFSYDYWTDFRSHVAAEDALATAFVKSELGRVRP